MTDEDKLKVYSEPPPPTDEIDQEWGKDGAPAAAAQPGRGPGHFAKAAEAEDEEEDEDEDEDGEDDDGDEDAHAAPARGADRLARPSGSVTTIPDWVPFAVLAVLVVVGIVGGLGILGGKNDAGAQDTEAPAGQPKAEPTK